MLLPTVVRCADQGNRNAEELSFERLNGPLFEEPTPSRLTAQWFRRTI
jgi:hypothetical protein